MKKFVSTLIAVVVMLSITATAAAQTKTEKRYAYTLQHLKLNKQTEAKFGPVLKAYLDERKAAGDIYDEVKKKYKAAEKAGTLTDAQAKQLFEAKLESETKELAAKKKFYPEFLKVLKPKKVWYAFDLANEKMSKIDGKEKEE